MADITCPECGDVHRHLDEPSAEVGVAEEVASADVEVARIEADRDVTIARIAAKSEESHDETEVESLRAEMRGMREILDRLTGGSPEADDSPADVAEPVVVQAVDTAPDVDAPPVRGDDSEPSSPRKSRGIGMWQ